VGIIGGVGREVTVVEGSVNIAISISTMAMIVASEGCWVSLSLGVDVSVSKSGSVFIVVCGGLNDDVVVSVVIGVVLDVAWAIVSISVGSVSTVLSTVEASSVVTSNIVAITVVGVGVGVVVISVSVVTIVTAASVVEVGVLNAGCGVFWNVVTKRGWDEGA
jgi:hypothetical protein